MPINRNGKHWCNPAAEQPDEQGGWTCPDCGTTWVYTETEHGALWETPADKEARLETEKRIAESRATETEAVDGR